MFTWDKILWAKWLIDSRGFALRLPADSGSVPATTTTRDSSPSDDETDDDDDKTMRSLSDQPDKSTCPNDVRVVDVGGDATVKVPIRVTCLIPVLDMFNHHPVGHCRPPRFNPATR